MEEHKLQELWNRIDSGEDLTDMIHDADHPDHTIDRMQTLHKLLMENDLPEPPSSLDDGIMSMVLKEEVEEDIKAPVFSTENDNIIMLVGIGFMILLTVGITLGFLFKNDLAQENTPSILDTVQGNSIYLYAAALVVLMGLLALISKGYSILKWK